MKHIITILLLSLAFNTFAQYDTIMENSYMRMLDKRYDELQPIEGIWGLTTTDVTFQFKKEIDRQQKFTRVAIYKAGNIYAITYLSKEFHATDQISMLSYDEYLYECPSENISAAAIMQGIQLRVSLSSKLENMKRMETEMVFTKVYPLSGTTRQN